ncbi:MAG TPA: hypothetical protein VFV75_14715 [Candidatus Polarisedimenticolaceae bacterium]|nr:hypothetical protein [Candidatus Polarisedimenticolaceae bacterium]
MSSVLEALERHAAALASAGSAAALLGALLEGSRMAASRVGILLLRGGRLRGWGSAGTTATAAASFRSLDLAPEASWAAAALRAEGPTPVSASPLAGADEPPSLACLASPVRAGGRVVALLVADRVADGPWAPPALSVLCTMASLRLEADLARRRLAPPEPVPSTVAPEDAPAPEPTGLAPAAPAPPPAPAHPRHEEARRFARLIATDIRLYNEEAVVAGRRQGDLLRRLQDPITRGRETFVRRFGDLGDDGLRLLHEACVQVLAAGDEALLPFHTLRPTGP